MLIPVYRGQPTLQAVHIDVPLTNMSVAYTQNQSQYIFPKVFPVLPVDKQSDKYWVFPRNEWMIDEAKKRTDSTESAGGGYTFSQDAYSCDVYAYHRDLGSQVRANADAGLGLERGAVQFVTAKLLLRQEIQWAADFFKTGVWGTDMTGTAASVANNDFIYWDDYADSDPFEDIERGRALISGVTGYDPNVLVMGADVWRRLKHHPIIRDRVKYTSAANTTTQLIASLFEIDNIYVAKSLKATNNRGGAAAYSYIQGSKNMWMGYVAPTVEPFSVTAGMTFAWTGVSGSLGLTVGVDSFEIRKLKAIRYEAEVAFSNKVLAPDLGVFYNGVVQ